MREFTSKNIEESAESFTKLYDKYIGKHTGIAKFVLDLLLFVIICGVGLVSLSLIYGFMVWFLGFFFDNAGQIVFWIFLLIVALFITSKIVEFIGKRGGDENEK